MAAIPGVAIGTPARTDSVAFCRIFCCSWWCWGLEASELVRLATLGLPSLALIPLTYHGVKWEPKATMTLSRLSSVSPHARSRLSNSEETPGRGRRGRWPLMPVPASPPPMVPIPAVRRTLSGLRSVSPQGRTRLSISHAMSMILGTLAFRTISFMIGVVLRPLLVPSPRNTRNAPRGPRPPTGSS